VVVAGVKGVKRLGGRALVAAPPAPAPAAPDMAERYKKVETLAGRRQHRSARARAGAGAVGTAQGTARAVHAGPRGLRRRPHQERWATTATPSRWTRVPRRSGAALAPRYVAGEPRQADGALDLVIEKIGAPAADLLEKVANDGSDLERGNAPPPRWTRSARASASIRCRWRSSS
jgi:hypothetical protein